MSKRLSTGYCPLCHRYTRLTFHHLIPKKMHRRTYFKKHYSKARLNEGVAICRKCHDGIHRFYTEMELAKQLNTLMRLKKDEKLARHFDWVSKQTVQL